MSYKETLMGEKPNTTDVVDDPFNEDDIDIEEGEITRGLVNEIISVDFSDRNNALAVKTFDQIVVLKLLGRRIGYNTLHSKLIYMKAFSINQTHDIENDYFLATFRARSEYLSALADGPWTIFGHYLTVEPWIVDFSTSQPYPSKIIAWIRLLGLPTTLYKRSLITEIDECIGRVILIDYQTESGKRGRFMRMAVSIDLNC
ncbi:hypothetical protein V6N12_069641 [Hibiscus sabdariffa]|uniref:DUF4283 domain-containing protein n=1 Tax=Hibiscus sabdariffa TaxID=183260 RepID=A0ABR2FEF9_9ROSI